MRPAWFVAASATLAGVAHAAPLTYAAALKLADQTAPAIEAASLEVKAARSAAVAAGRLPDPTLSVGISDFPISGPLAGRPDLDNFTMLTLDFSQDVPSGAKRRAGRSRAAADITQAEAGQIIERRKVRIAAGLAWIDLYYARRRLAALDQVGRAIAPLRSTAPEQLASDALRPSQSVEPEQFAAALADRRAALVAAVARPAPNSAAGSRAAGLTSRPAIHPSRRSIRSP